MHYQWAHCTQYHLIKLTEINDVLIAGFMKMESEFFTHRNEAVKL